MISRSILLFCVRKLLISFLISVDRIAFVYSQLIMSSQKQVSECDCASLSYLRQWKIHLFFYSFCSSPSEYKSPSSSVRAIGHQIERKMSGLQACPLLTPDYHPGQPFTLFLCSAPLIAFLLARIYRVSPITLTLFYGIFLLEVRKENGNLYGPIILRN